MNQLRYRIIFFRARGERWKVFRYSGNTMTITFSSRNPVCFCSPAGIHVWPAWPLLMRFLFSSSYAYNGTLQEMKPLCRDRLNHSLPVEAIDTALDLTLQNSCSFAKTVNLWFWIRFCNFPRENVPLHLPPNLREKPPKKIFFVLF